MKIDVRNLEAMTDEEEQYGTSFNKGSRKPNVKTKLRDEFNRKDNHKFNKHPKKDKSGFDD